MKKNNFTFNQSVANIVFVSAIIFGLAAKNNFKFLKEPEGMVVIALYLVVIVVTLFLKYREKK